MWKQLFRVEDPVSIEVRTHSEARREARWDSAPVYCVLVCILQDTCLFLHVPSFQTATLNGSEKKSFTVEIFGYNTKQTTPDSSLGSASGQVGKCVCYNKTYNSRFQSTALTSEGICRGNTEAT